MLERVEARGSRDLGYAQIGLLKQLVRRRYSQIEVVLEGCDRHVVAELPFQLPTRQTYVGRDVVAGHRGIDRLSHQAYGIAYSSPCDSDFGRAGLIFAGAADPMLEKMLRNLLCESVSSMLTDPREHHVGDRGRARTGHQTVFDGIELSGCLNSGVNLLEPFEIIPADRGLMAVEQGGGGEQLGPGFDARKLSAKNAFPLQPRFDSPIL